MLTTIERDTEKKIIYMVIGEVAFVNCTPHPLHVYTSPDAMLPTTIPTSGFVARAEEYLLVTGDVAGIPLFNFKYDGGGSDTTQPSDFPVCEAWIEKGMRAVYIVSLRFIQILGNEYCDYPILYTPGPAKRASDGTTVGCVGLSMQVSDDHDAIGGMGVLEPDWDKAPAWANYFAVDEDDVACWYEYKPTMYFEANPNENDDEEAAGYWRHQPNTKIKRAGYRRLGIPWQLSLRTRNGKD